MMSRLPVVALFCSMAMSLPVMAQETPARPRESAAIGATASVGWFGRVIAVRASAPVNERWAFDTTVGHIGGRGDTASGAQGLSAAAQFRWLRRRRYANGSSGHWIFGVMA